MIYTVVESPLGFTHLQSSVEVLPTGSGERGPDRVDDKIPAGRGRADGRRDDDAGHCGHGENVRHREGRGTARVTPSATTRRPDPIRAPSPCRWPGPRTRARPSAAARCGGECSRSRRHRYGPRGRLGERIVVSALAITVPVKAANSIPDPIVAPCTYVTVSLARATCVRVRATLRSSRMRCALAGSAASRTRPGRHPRQNVLPSPRSSRA